MENKYQEALDRVKELINNELDETKMTFEQFNYIITLQEAVDKAKRYDTFIALPHNIKQKLFELKQPINFEKLVDIARRDTPAKTRIQIYCCSSNEDWYCTDCNNEVGYKDTYCKWCGRQLDWSDADEQRSRKRGYYKITTKFEDEYD